MSRKETIELEWFKVKDQEPETYTPIITDYNSLYLLIKEEDSEYYIKANEADDFCITKEQFTEWAYYPF